MNVNSFRITTHDGEEIGVAFDPLLGMANHSCVPNAYLSFEGRRATMRALRPIGEGEEITISYIDTTQPLPFRRAFLQQHYYFTCTCPACASDLSPYEIFTHLNPPFPTPSIYTPATQRRILATAARNTSHHPTTPSDKPAPSPTSPNPAIAASRQLTDPHARWRLLTAELSTLDHLRQSDRLAIYPYPQLLTELQALYSSAGEYECVLLLQLLQIFHVEPFLYPAPYHPARFASLDRLARLLDLRFSEPRLDLRVLTRLEGGVVRAVEGVGWARCLWGVHRLLVEGGARVWDGDGVVLGEVSGRQAERAWVARLEGGEGLVGKSGGGGEWEGDFGAWEALEGLAGPGAVVRVVMAVDLRGGGKR